MVEILLYGSSFPESLFLEVDILLDLKYGFFLSLDFLFVLSEYIASTSCLYFVCVELDEIKLEGAGNGGGDGLLTVMTFTFRLSWHLIPFIFGLVTLDVDSL